MDSNMKRSIILDNYQDTSNRMIPEDTHDYIKINSNNVSCIDNLDIYLKIEDNIIVDASFEGEACVISISSTNILMNMLIGKTKDEAIYIIDNYLKMINEEEYDKDLLKDLNVYDEIYLQPNRKNCALLPANAIRKALEQTK